MSTLQERLSQAALDRALKEGKDPNPSLQSAEGSGLPPAQLVQDNEQSQFETGMQGSQSGARVIFQAPVQVSVEERIAALDLDAYPEHSWFLPNHKRLVLPGGKVVLADRVGVISLHEGQDFPRQLSRMAEYEKLSVAYKLK